MVEDGESVTEDGGKQGSRCQHEIRYDPVTGRSVIYAPMRQIRPRDVASTPRAGVPPTFDKDCPFCPGNEAWLPPLIDERPGGDAAWRTRVVLNRYPAVVSDIDAPARVNGIFSVFPARGRHEIIIESPKHDGDLAHAPRAEVEAVLQTCYARYRALADSGEFATIFLFRNGGVRAGASLIHPHTQLVAMTQVTGELERRRAIAKSYFERTGRCILCDIVSGERRYGQRLILESEFFLGFVPYAAEVPYEVWLVPKRHSPSFADAEAALLCDFAEALPNCLSRLATRGCLADYNLVLQSDFAARQSAGERHWYLRVYPRLTTPGGFELGSDMAINPSLPEADAQCLRDLKVALRSTAMTPT